MIGLAERIGRSYFFVLSDPVGQLWVVILAKCVIFAETLGKKNLLQMQMGPIRIQTLTVKNVLALTMGRGNAMQCLTAIAEKRKSHISSISLLKWASFRGLLTAMPRRINFTYLVPNF